MKINHSHSAQSIGSQIDSDAKLGKKNTISLEGFSIVDQIKNKTFSKLFSRTFGNLKFKVYQNMGISYPFKKKNLEASQSLMQRTGKYLRHKKVNASHSEHQQIYESAMKIIQSEEWMYEQMGNFKRAVKKV